MKKIVVAALLVLMTATLSGCSWFQATDEAERIPTESQDLVDEAERIPAEPQDLVDEAERIPAEPQDLSEEPVAMSDSVTLKSTTKSFDELTKDSYSLGGQSSGDVLTLDGDTLEVSVGYSGGCGDHEFNAYWTGSFLESYPVQVPALLVHDAKGDTCEAYIQNTVSVSLVSLKKAYQDAYQTDTGEILLSVVNGDEKETILYSF